MKQARYTTKCPKCDGPDSAIRWKDTVKRKLICLTCGAEWKQAKDKYLRNLQDIETRVVFLKKRKTILVQFEHACTEASRHFADDSGKEWGIAQSYAEKAKTIASANPEFMTEYLEILKDQLVSQSDIFGIEGGGQAHE